MAGSAEYFDELRPLALSENQGLGKCSPFANCGHSLIECYGISVAS
jgi:hypothetical protein